MKKNEILTFTAPNGVEVTAVVVDTVSRNLNYAGHSCITTLCYSQNRLFTWKQEFYAGECRASNYGEVIVDYCIIPEYDAMLDAEQQKFEDDCYEALSSIGDTDF